MRLVKRIVCQENVPVSSFQKNGLKLGRSCYLSGKDGRADGLCRFSGLELGVELGVEGDGGRSFGLGGVVTQVQVRGMGGTVMNRSWDVIGC